MVKNTKAKNNNKYLKINIFFGVVIVVLVGVLFYCGMNMKTHEDQKKIDLHEHLLNQVVQLTYGREGRVCESVENGLSKDDDVYIRFWCQDYSEDHEPITEKDYDTLYFQSSDTTSKYYKFAQALAE